MKLLFGFGLVLLFVFTSCGGEEKKDSSKGKTKKAPTEENKDLSKANYELIVGEWRADKISETKEDPLQAIPTSSDIFLIINADRTFYTTFNLDTITSGNYTIKEKQVVFNETKNHVGGEVRYLSAFVKFNGNEMELEGEWVEHSGMKEYHHSSFVKDDYDLEKIKEKVALSKKEK